MERNSIDIKRLYVPADQRKKPVMEYQKWQAYPGCHTPDKLCYANKHTASVGQKQSTPSTADYLADVYGICGPRTSPV